MRLAKTSILGLMIVGWALSSLMRCPALDHRKKDVARPSTSGMRLLTPHLLAITFSSANFAFSKEEDGFTTRTLGTKIYHLPLPDFASRASVVKATLYAGKDGEVASIDGLSGVPADCKTAGVREDSATIYCPSSVAVSFRTQQREIIVSFPSTAENLPSQMSVVVETRQPMQRDKGWATNDPSAVTDVSSILPVMDYAMRDVFISTGAAGEYFLTGSTGSPDIWAVTSDIQIWRSKDLRSWNPVITTPRARSVVWSIDRDGTWERKVRLRDGAPFRPLWAPEIHFIKGTYWIPYSVPGLGTGLLVSASGKPEGPYQSALHRDGPLTPGIDASLFEDDDGRVYFLWAGGKIARMTDSMDALAEPERQLRPANAPLVGFEGSSLFKYRGRYYLSGADWSNGDYNCFTASATSIYGPYSDRYISVPHGGHNNFFLDGHGKIWSTFFGSDSHAKLHERPAIIPMHLDLRGELKPSDLR